MKKFHIEAFSEDVNNRLEYLSCSRNDDSNTEIHKTLSAIMKATNLHAPLKNYPDKKMKIKAKPWLTKEFLNLFSKTKLFEQFNKKQNKNLYNRPGHRRTPLENWKRFFRYFVHIFGCRLGR